MTMITELDIEADIRSVHVNKVNFMTSFSLLAIVNVRMTMFKEKNCLSSLCTFSLYFQVRTVRSPRPLNLLLCDPATGGTSGC